MNNEKIEYSLMQRRHFMKLLGATTATALCSPLFFNIAEAQADTDESAWQKEPAYGRTITIGYNGGLCLGTFGIAHINGFYKDLGLDTKVIRMSVSEVDAVGTGKVDIAGGHIATLLVPTVNGVRIKITAGIHTGCKSIYVLNNSDITNTKDLIAKTIAIPNGIGGSDQNITMRFLNRDEIDPMKVKYKVVESGAAVLALQSGEIQAALLDDQFAKAFLNNGTLRMIRSLALDEDFKKEACCIHVVNKDFYEQNPITTKKLTMAHERAKHWISANREEAIKTLADNKWASGDLKTALEIFNTYSYDVSEQVTEQTLRAVINDYKSFGFINKNKDTETVLKEIWEPILQS